MKNLISLFSGILLFLFFHTGHAQVLNLPAISEEKLQNHVNFLASDSLQGRGITTYGLNLAAGYLKKNLQNLGLTPPENGFFQSFILSSLIPDCQNTFIKILNPKGKKVSKTEKFIAYNQTTHLVDVEGELIFAGFGASNSYFESDHSAETQIKGKIVMYSAGTPQSFNEGNSSHWNSLQERKKMDNFFNAGATALIVVTSSQDSANKTYHRIKELTSRQNFSLPVRTRKLNQKIFIITPETADLLTGKKVKWNNALQMVSAGTPAESIALKNNRIHIRSSMNEEELETNNVIGIIEGSDTLLKDECVVFIAHYDHLGISSNGAVYNGADDNASGVAVLLEIAAAFSQLKEKPRRSMLFLFPSAEEIGIFGTEYYSSNPVFPIENTVGCINLDMVGRVFEPRDSVWNRSLKQVKDFDGIYALVNHYNPKMKSIVSEASSQLDLIPDFSLPARFFNSSDHYHFHKNQVPVFNVSTGYTADYHKSSDTAERIRTDKMKRVAKLCFLVGMELGNQY